MSSTPKLLRRISTSSAVAASTNTRLSDYRSRKRFRRASSDISDGRGGDSESDSSDGGYTLALRSIRRQIEALKRDEETRYLGTMTHLDALDDAVTDVTSSRNRERRRCKKKRRREGTTGLGEVVVKRRIAVAAQKAQGVWDNNIEGNEIAVATDKSVSPSGQALDRLVTDSTPTPSSFREQNLESPHQPDSSPLGETQDETDRVPPDSHANAETAQDETADKNIRNSKSPVDRQSPTRAGSETYGAPWTVQRKRPADKLALKKRGALIRFIRHRIQKALLFFMSHPTEEPDEAILTRLAEHFAKLEGYTHIDEETFQYSKIHKVIREVDKLPSVPGDNKYHFKRRAHDLLLRWKKPLATNPGAPLMRGITVDAPPPPPSGERPDGDHAQSTLGSTETSHTIWLPRDTMNSQPPQSQETSLLQTDARHQKSAWNSEMTEENETKLLPKLTSQISGNLNTISHEESIDPSPRDTKESGDDVPARGTHPVIASVATDDLEEDARKPPRHPAEAASQTGVSYDNRSNGVESEPAAVQATPVTQPSRSTTADPLPTPRTPTSVKLSDPHSTSSAATAVACTDGIPHMAMSEKARGKQRMAVDEDYFLDIREGPSSNKPTDGSAQSLSPERGALTIEEEARRMQVEVDEALARSLAMTWESSQMQERHDEEIAIHLQKKYNDGTYDSENDMESIFFHAPDQNDSLRLEEDGNQVQQSDAIEVKRVVSQDTEMKDTPYIVENGFTEHSQNQGSQFRREGVRTSNGGGWLSMGIQNSSHTITTLSEPASTVQDSLTMLRDTNTSYEEQPHSHSDGVGAANPLTDESDDGFRIIHARPVQTKAMDWDSPPHERRKTNSLSSPPRPQSMFFPAYETAKPAVVPRLRLIAPRIPHDNGHSDSSRNISKNSNAPEGCSFRIWCSPSHGEESDEDEDELIENSHPKVEQDDESQSSHTASPTP
ncbi:MAG: hypothetical protein M1813_003200 [Trichoglossum hirsutum]|nr:MAG: hypothetical protein M1813_003200 [Trichoglossum hirsutum]